MGYEVLRTEAFEDDYDHAVQYLIFKQGSLEAARRLADEIDDTREVLKANPFVRAISTKEYCQNRSYREYPLSRYLIVYVVEKEAVIWLRLFHQRQSPERQVIDWR